MTATESVAPQHLDRLLEVSRALVGVLDLDAVLDQLLDAARELTDARYSALGVLDSSRGRFDRFVVSGLSESSQEIAGVAAPTGQGVFRTVLNSLEPVRIADIGSHPDSVGFPDGHPPMSSFLGVPVIIGAQAWGVIYCAENLDGEFSDEQERLLVLLSGWASVAIENAALYERSEKSRRALERALRAHRATREVAQAIGSDLDLDHVLDLIARRGRRLVDADSLLILLQENGRCHAAAGAGNLKPVADPPAELIAGLCSGTDEIAGEVWTALGVRSAGATALVPLIYRGETIGMLCTFRSSDRPFTAEDRELLETYAASAATRVAIASTVRRERLQDAVAAADAERRRWARELHDQTLQGLAALKLALAGREDTGEAIAIIEDEIVSLRSIIRELRPASLDELGWDQALKSLVERYAGDGRPDVTLTVDGKPSTESGRVQAEAFRIIQEALTNAVRHASATAITVGVEVRDTELLVTVSDNGRGFDPGARHEGLGLVGMRERVELAGGTLQIDSGADGTTVRVTLAR